MVEMVFCLLTGMGIMYTINWLWNTKGKVLAEKEVYKITRRIDEFKTNTEQGAILKYNRLIKEWEDILNNNMQGIISCTIELKEIINSVIKNK